MEIVPTCDYCIQNEGENKKHGFMWHCKVLGYCVPFGTTDCKAKRLGKGDFEPDEVRIKELNKD